MVDELVDDSLGEVAAFFGLARARNDDTRCGRDDERGQLRDESIADGEDCEGRGRICHCHVALEHADEKAADDVDERDDNPRDSVPFDEFTRTVH